MAMADPGFPVGGAPSRWGGADLQRGCYSEKTYAKMKELDPVGRRVLAAPPGSANAWVILAEQNFTQFSALIHSRFVEIEL